MEKFENCYSKEEAQKEAGFITKSLDKKYPNTEGRFTSEQYNEEEKHIREGQIELIKKLSKLNVPVYIAGGYACELLLQENDGKFDGEFSAPHKDVDVVIKRDEQDVIKEKLNEFDLKIKEKIELGQDVPFKLYLKNTTGIQADFGLIDTDSITGEPYITVLGDNQSHKVYFSSDMLEGKQVTFNDVSIKVISPRSLIQSLIFYPQIGRGTLREKDTKRANELLQKFFPGETLESDLFKVRIES
jgi:hypothetical protein